MRSSHNQQELWMLFSILLAGGLILCGLVMLLLEKLVLSPLARLSAEVMRIGRNEGLSGRLAVAGDDELARMAGAVNGMLTALETSQEELRKKETLGESEERYHSLVELSPDAVYIVRDGRFIFANAAGVTLLGASEADELIGHPWLDMVHPDFRMRGVFSALNALALAEIKRRGCANALLLSDGRSTSGQAFIHKIGAVHHHSEYEMDYKREGMPDQAGLSICFRKAANADAREVARQNAIYFGERFDEGGEGREARSGHRPRRGDSPDHPGALAPHEEQPRAHRRAGRRQDRRRRGPGREDCGR
jgi:PAS domain S-box-containing protein